MAPDSKQMYRLSSNRWNFFSGRWTNVIQFKVVWQVDNPVWDINSIKSVSYIFMLSRDFREVFAKN